MTVPSLGLARPELLGLLFLAPLLGALLVLAAAGRKHAMRTFAGSTALSTGSTASSVRSCATSPPTTASSPVYRQYWPPPAFAIAPRPLSSSLLTMATPSGRRR